MSSPNKRYWNPSTFYNVVLLDQRMVVYSFSTVCTLRSPILVLLIFGQGDKLGTQLWSHTYTTRKVCVTEDDRLQTIFPAGLVSVYGSNCLSCCFVESGRWLGKLTWNSTMISPFLPGCLLIGIPSPDIVLRYPGLIISLQGIDSCLSSSVFCLDFQTVKR
eukprot:gb/GECG01011141.1/.p1 GENE.gb/GECG01011141.1/~~gb/GECG01011141.1/.p1  ORF type:complete len:161 (+),score=3.51 gb/GECG01011141.1/:1-483(+)